MTMTREKQGRQARKASVHRKGRTNGFHLSVPSDVLLWSLLNCRQLSVFAPVAPATMREIQNVVCLDAFIFHLIPMTDYRHWDRPKGVTSGEVSELSSRRSIAIAFFSACPRVCYGNKRTVQRRSCLLWGELRKQESSIRKWNLLVCW